MYFIFYGSFASIDFFKLQDTYNYEVNLKYGGNIGKSVLPVYLSDIFHSVSYL